MKNINFLKINKLTSLVLTASIMLGATTIPTKTNCDFSASVLSALSKTPSVFGRFITSKWGVKTIASTIFIAQNIMLFSQDQDKKINPIQEKSTDSFCIPFRLGQAGTLLNNASDNKHFDTVSSGINLLAGEDVYGNAWKLAEKKVTDGFNYCCDKVSFLGNIREKAKAIKNWWNQDGYIKQFTNTLKQFTNNLQDFSDSKLWKFATSSHGVKTFAQLMGIASSGMSFYNQDNNIESGLTKTMPFYISTSSKLLAKLAGSKVYDSITTGLKLALGEKLAKSVKNSLPVPKIVPSMFRDRIKDFVF